MPAAPAFSRPGRWHVPVRAAREAASTLQTIAPRAAAETGGALPQRALKQRYIGQKFRAKLARPHGVRIR